MTSRILHGAALAALVLALAQAACSTYRGDYSYDPAPAMSAQSAPRVMAAVYGVLRGDSENPAGIDVRLRLEAGGDATSIERGDLSLVTADLVPLELVRVEPEGGLVTPAGGAGTWRLTFAFPPGRGVADLDLSGIVLAWRYGAGAVRTSGSFAFSKVVEPIWGAPWYGGWYGGWYGPWGHGYGGWYTY